MEEYDVESILDMYEESYVREPSAMAQGGRIPFAKAKSVQKIVGTNQSGTPEGAQERLKSFVDNFLKKNKRLPGKQEIRNLGNFDFYTIKKGIDSGKIEVLENLNVISQLKVPNEQILKLSKSKIINDIFKTGKTSIKDINKVKKVIGNVSDSVAATRILQLANIYSGSGAEDFRNLNIKSKFKKNAAKILSDSPYTGYIRNVNEALIGKSVGESSIKGTKSKIVQDADYIKSGIAKAYDIDEPLGVASSVNRGSVPYGIYGQIIDKSKNKLKVGWDARKSQLELELQEAIQSKDNKLIDDAVKKFNKEAKAAEKLFNKNIKKGQKKIVIPEISLDKPSKTIANYKNLNDDYKKAFDAVHSSQGYSFKIPEDLKPIPEIRKDLKDPKILSEVKKSADLGAGRIYSNPFFDPKLMGRVIGDIASSLGSPTAIVGLNVGLGVDPRSSLDRAILGGEAALAPAGIKALMSRLDNIKNPLVRKSIETAAGLRLPGVFTPANVMKAARFASPVGIATLAGEGLYQLGKLGYKEQQMINEMRENDPEAYQKYLAEQQELMDVSA